MKDGSSFFNHFVSYLVKFLIHLIEFPENSRLFQLGSYLYESGPGSGGELGIVPILANIFLCLRGHLKLSYCALPPYSSD